MRGVLMRGEKLSKDLVRRCAAQNERGVLTSSFSLRTSAKASAHSADKRDIYRRRTERKSRRGTLRTAISDTSREDASPCLSARCRVGFLTYEYTSPISDSRAARCAGCRYFIESVAASKLSN